MNDLRKCRQCKKEKPLTAFGSNRKWKDGKDVYCLLCRNQWARDYRKRNPTIQHNLTNEEYQRLLVAQKGVCAICKRPSAKRMCVDHNHSCCPKEKSCGKCIRGLLCINCNWMIGQAKESIHILFSAIEYLRNFQDGESE